MGRTAGYASEVAGKMSPKPIERFLGLFTDIRPGEAQKALLLALNIFLLLLAYYLIKPVRFRSRYLLLIALLIGIYNFINMTGEYIISDVSTRVALRAVESGTAAGLTMEQLQGKFFADYQFLQNLLALFIQLFLVSRIFKWVGVGGALLFLPLIALGGYGLISFGALLILVKWVKAVENGTDYSLMNTTKAALFLITPREEKYKAKAAIDTFFVRGGDAVAALCVFIGTTYFALTIEKFAVINVLMVLLWIAICFLIMKEYKKLKSRESTA